MTVGPTPTGEQALVVDGLARKDASPTTAFEPAMPIWNRLRRGGRYTDLDTPDDGIGGGDLDDDGMDDDIETIEIDAAEDVEMVSGRWAFEDVTFSVRSGEGLAIVGNPGSGAGVLFRVLDRMLLPDRGRAVLAGRPSRSVAYNMAIAPRYVTVQKQAAAMAVAAGVPRRDRRRWVEDALDVAFGHDSALGLGDARQLTRRLAIAAATDPTADFLLIDEITILDDTPYRDRCLARARSAMSAGAGAIVVGQKPVPMVELCTRAILFERGRIVEEGDPAELIDLARRRAGAESFGRLAKRLKVAGFDARAAILATHVASSPGGTATVRVELETSVTDVRIAPRIVLRSEESGPTFVVAHRAAPLLCQVPSRYLLTVEATLPDDTPPLVVDFYGKVSTGGTTSDIGRERIGTIGAQPEHWSIEGADDGAEDSSETELHAEWKLEPVGESAA